MHEAGLLAAAVAALVSATDGAAVLRVTVEIGPGVAPGAAEHAWREAAAGGPAEAAEVTWQRAQDVLTCFGCAHEYPGDRLSPCPRCGADGLVTIPAPEIVIVEWAAAPSAYGGGP